jgi:hypothetical protein
MVLEAGAITYYLEKEFGKEQGDACLHLNVIWK